MRCPLIFILAIYVLAQPIQKVWMQSNRVELPPSGKAALDEVLLELPELVRDDTDDEQEEPQTPPDTPLSPPRF